MDPTFAPLLNPHGGKSKTWISRDGTRVLKTMRGDNWQVQRLLSLWRKASDVGVTPHVIEHRVVKQNSLHHIVYEHVPGSNMYVWAREARTPALKAMMRKVHALLLKLHRLGIVFCDLNPGNVIIDMAGRPWLIDWETAVSLDDDLDALRQFPAMLKAYR